jgi:4-amino-4-deoxy-L-arabinose transferase and related glycosyltransferases of PMT family
LGLAFLAKYAAIYFLLSFLILICFDKKTFLNIKKNILKLLVFFVILFLVLLPNIFWNITNSWVTFSHTVDNTNLKNLNINFYEPLKFVVAQILMIGPILFFSFLYFFKSFKLDFENKFLLIFSLPIIIIVLFESFLVRANANWAAPALISLFILFFRLVSKKNKMLIIINFGTNYAIGVFLFVSIAITANFKMFDRIRGVDDFVDNLLGFIGDKDIVITDRIIFSNISYEIRNKPNKIYMPHKDGGLITNHFQMMSPLNQKHQKDFYLIGDKSSIKYLVKDHTLELIEEF